MKHVQVVAAEGIIHPLEVARSFAPEELLYPIVTPETMDEREERAWEKEKMRRRKAKEKKKREVTFVSESEVLNEEEGKEGKRGKKRWGGEETTTRRGREPKLTLLALAFVRSRSRLRLLRSPSTSPTFSPVRTSSSNSLRR